MLGNNTSSLAFIAGNRAFTSNFGYLRLSLTTDRQVDAREVTLVMLLWVTTIFDEAPFAQTIIVGTYQNAILRALCQRSGPE